MSDEAVGRSVNPAISEKPGNPVAELMESVKRRRAEEDLSDKEDARLEDILLRCRIMDMRRSVSETARWLFLSKQYVSRTIKAFERDGVAALQRRVGRPEDPERRLEILAELELLKEHAGLTTPAQYHAALNERIDPPLSLSRCRVYLRLAGIHFRKRRNASL